MSKLNLGSLPAHVEEDLIDIYRLFLYRLSVYTTHNSGLHTKNLRVSNNAYGVNRSKKLCSSLLFFPSMVACGDSFGPRR